MAIIKRSDDRTTLEIDGRTVTAYQLATNPGTASVEGVSLRRTISQGTSLGDGPFFTRSNGTRIIPTSQFGTLDGPNLVVVQRRNGVLITLTYNPDQGIAPVLTANEFAYRDSTGVLTTGTGIVAANNDFTSVVVPGQIIPFGEVEVRPTNVTATAIVEQPTGTYTEVVLLKNGPNGGFTQTGLISAGTWYVNEVVDAIITNA